MADKDLQSIIASTLTCRVDHQYASLITSQIIYLLCPVSISLSNSLVFGLASINLGNSLLGHTMLWSYLLCPVWLFPIPGDPS